MLLVFQIETLPNTFLVYFLFELMDMVNDNDPKREKSYEDLLRC